MKSSNKSGFTLLELGVTIVIISLLLGGILVSRDMIKTAFFKHIISETEKMQVALGNFKERYEALPGDMLNATSYWGAEGSCPNASVGVVPKTVTCNGDGNGVIAGTGGTLGGLTAVETFRAIQQLANAQLIPGIYSGTPSVSCCSPAAPQTVVGKNILEIEGGVGLLIGNPPAANALPTLYEVSLLDIAMRNAIIVGKDTPAAYPHSFNMGPFLTGDEMYYIDNKIDDGKPGYGEVHVYSYSGQPIYANCASTTSMATAAYVRNNAARSCAFYRWIPQN